MGVRLVRRNCLHFLHRAGKLYSIVFRGGTIHRCIDISRYISRDTYRDIIFYNHNFFFFFRNDFHIGRQET